MAANVGLSQEDADWVRDAIERHLGVSRLSIEADPIPSRIATVHRITIQTTSGARRFYLKRYSADLPAGDLEARVEELGSIARSVRRSGGVLPFVAVSCWPARRPL